MPINSLKRNSDENYHRAGELVSQETTSHVDTIHEIAGHWFYSWRAMFFVSFCVFHFAFFILCSFILRFSFCVLHFVVTWLGPTCGHATPNGCRWGGKSWGRSQWSWRPRRGRASSVSRTCKQPTSISFVSAQSELWRKNVQMKNSFGSHITIWSAPSQNLPPGKQPNVRNGI